MTSKPRSGPVATRQVHCANALEWLPENAPLEGCSVVTSLPDISGLPGLDLAAWRDWFVSAARLALQATDERGVTIFYQTDVKRDGIWVDKGYLCHRAAELSHAELLWHKIVCRKTPGETAFGRPGYAHLLCYSRGVRDVVARSYADVLPSTGTMTWSRATGALACELACRYVLSHTETRTIVDPFCGVGTVLAVANRLGLDAVGVEVVRKRARKARNLDALQLAESGSAATRGTP